MLRKRVLIAAANSAEIPIIQYLKKKGLEVVTLSGSEFDNAHEYSDDQVFYDYSNPELVKKAFVEKKCDFLIPGSNDFSMFSCALVSEELGLKGYDGFKKTSIIHYKNKLRELQQSLNLNFPKYLTLSENHDFRFVDNIGLNFPVIVKPVDMTGGKGISICHDKSRLDYAIKQVRKISKKVEIIIEEFIEGSYHGFSCIVKNGKIIFSFDDDEYYWENKFLVGGTSSPSSLSEQKIASLKKQLQKICESLELVDGLFHAQCIDTQDKIYITEICRRTPGDLYLKFVSLRTSYDYIGAIVNGYIGDDIPDNEDRLSKDLYRARLCLHPKENGVIKSINLGFLDDYLIDSFIWLKPGDFIGNYLTEKVGIIFLSFKSYEEMKNFISDFPTMEIIQMEPKSEY